MAPQLLTISYLFQLNSLQVVFLSNQANSPPPLFLPATPLPVGTHKRDVAAQRLRWRANNLIWTVDQRFRLRPNTASL